jgi:hypothetical protein
MSGGWLMTMIDHAITFCPSFPRAHTANHFELLDVKNLIGRRPPGFRRQLRISEAGVLNATTFHGQLLPHGRRAFRFSIKGLL